MHDFPTAKYFKNDITSISYDYELKTIVIIHVFLELYYIYFFKWTNSYQNTTNTFYNLIFLKSNRKVISLTKKKIQKNLYSIKNINLYH
mgnify:CR=1 FL=1